MRQIFKKIWISTLCFVFWVSGCAKADQSTADPLNQEKSSAVVTDEDMPSEGNKEKYEADYEYLWDILENKYPYLNYIDENIVKTQDLHDRYGIELENVNDDAGFMDLIHRMLGEMKYFAHLDVITPNAYKNLYSMESGLICSKYDIMSVIPEVFLELFVFSYGEINKLFLIIRKANVNIIRRIRFIGLHFLVNHLGCLFEQGINLAFGKFPNCPLILREILVIQIENTRPKGIRR